VVLDEIRRLDPQPVVAVGGELARSAPTCCGQPPTLDPGVSSRGVSPTATIQHDQPLTLVRNSRCVRTFVAQDVPDALLELAPGQLRASPVLCMRSDPRFVPEPKMPATP
jgi:hypothetical protein